MICSRELALRINSVEIIELLTYTSATAFNGFCQSDLITLGTSVEEVGPSNSSTPVQVTNTFRVRMLSITYCSDLLHVKSYARHICTNPSNFLSDEAIDFENAMIEIATVN